MSNWIANFVTITGPKNSLEECEKLLSTVTPDCNDDPDRKVFNFGAVVPLPAEIMTKVQALSRNGKRPEDFVDGEYEWRKANWGTKWNACYVKTEHTANTLFYYFNTAWSFPEPVYKALSERFPELKISVEGIDLENPQIFNLVRGEFVDGEFTDLIPEPEDKDAALREIGGKVGFPPYYFDDGDEDEE